MFSGKAISTVCAILLALPLIHFAYLSSRELMDLMDPSPLVWASELDDYIAADQRESLPADPLLIIGGRRASLWKHTAELLAPMPVLSRGLGSATVDDLSAHYLRLVGFYRPSVIVLMPEPTEFHIRDNKSAQEYVDSVKAFAKLDDAHNVTDFLYVVAPIDVPLHPSDSEKIAEATRLLKLWADREARVNVIDVNPLFRNREGKLIASYFLGDGVNINEYGYLRLTVLLQGMLERDLPEVYAKTLAAPL